MKWPKRCLGISEKINEKVNLREKKSIVLRCEFKCDPLVLCGVRAAQSTWRPRCRLLYSFQSGVCRMQFLKRGRTVNFGFVSKGKTKSQIRTFLHFWVLCRLQRACSSLAVRERCNTLYLDFLPELCSSSHLHLSDHCTSILHFPRSFHFNSVFQFLSLSFMGWLNPAACSLWLLPGSLLLVAVCSAPVQLPALPVSSRPAPCLQFPCSLAVASELGSWGVMQNAKGMFQMKQDTIKKTWDLLSPLLWLHQGGLRAHVAVCVFHVHYWWDRCAQEHSGKSLLRQHCSRSTFFTWASLMNT